MFKKNDCEEEESGRTTSTKPKRLTTVMEKEMEDLPKDILEPHEQIGLIESAEEIMRLDEASATGEVRMVEKNQPSQPTSGQPVFWTWKEAVRKAEAETRL